MTPSDRRAIRLGAGVLLGGVLLFRVLPAGVREWRRAHEALTERRALLVRAEERLARMPALDSLAAVVRQRFVALAPRLVPGGTTTEAEASLDAMVSLLADRSRLQVKRADPLPDSARAGRLRRVGVAVELEGDWSGITGFLRALGHERTSLSLGDLALQARDPSSATTIPEVLTLQVDIQGWYLPGEGK